MSTVDALAHYHSYIINALDVSESVISCSLDLSKAFDKLDLDILLYKLYRFGIRNEALNWIESYSINRVYCVKIDNTLSHPFVG